MPDVHITDHGYVYPDVNKPPIGRVRRTRWSGGRTWEALDTDGNPINLPGRNMAFSSANAAASALLEVVQPPANRNQSTERHQA